MVPSVFEYLSLLHKIGVPWTNQTPPPSPTKKIKSNFFIDILLENYRLGAEITVQL